MNKFIKAWGKVIIICLLIFIFILLFLLLKSNSLDSKPFDPRISNANLHNFINLLSDPKVDAHGVFVLTPDPKEDAIVLTNKLNRAKPCDNGQLTSVNTITKGEDIPPPECLEGGSIEVDFGNQRLVTITPGKVNKGSLTSEYSDNKGGSRLLFHDADTRWISVCGQGTTNC
jgi:hypothetical protein